MLQKFCPGFVLTASCELARDPSAETVNSLTDITGVTIRSMSNMLEGKQARNLAEIEELSECIEDNGVKDREYIFFDQLKPGSFAKLLIQKQLTINYVSLCAVLLMALLLDENDLHPGNLGFYIVGDEIFFFKIDHDKMLYNALAATERKGIRRTDIFKAGEQNPITKNVLREFPSITGAHYWPAKHARLLPFATQSWSAEDAEAFAGLKDSDEFNRCKVDQIETLRDLDLQACLPECASSATGDFTDMHDLHVMISRAANCRHRDLVVAANNIYGAEEEASASEIVEHLVVKDSTSVNGDSPVEVLAGELRDIALDPKLSLVEAKDRALNIFEGAIKGVNTLEACQKIYDLMQTQQARFIFQLRSNLFIVRKLRGSHGLTSTAMTIYTMLHHQLSAHHEYGKRGEQINLLNILEGQLNKSPALFMPIYNGVSPLAPLSPYDPLIL